MINRDDIKIDKKKETRTKDISSMIAEGGLGADKYYNIVKEPSSEKEPDSDEIDEEDSKK